MVFPGDTDNGRNGDFYPVTPSGRVIASVFLVLGIGLLGFFVGFMVEFFARI